MARQVPILYWVGNLQILRFVCLISELAIQQGIDYFPSDFHV